MPYDKAQGTFFIRCRIKIPFLSYLLILLSFLVLSPILGLHLKRILLMISYPLRPFQYQ
ncbi:MAG TPA: hypothetical protein HPP56_04650 [Nitrospirae bacterium]|nr:hypothetical protein [Nitrospirota bacterium]